MFQASFVKTNDILKTCVDVKFGGLATIGRSLGSTAYIRINLCHDISVNSVSVHLQSVFVPRSYTNYLWRFEALFPTDDLLWLVLRSCWTSIFLIFLSNPPDLAFWYNEPLEIYSLFADPEPKTDYLRTLDTGSARTTTIRILRQVPWGGLTSVNVVYVHQSITRYQTTWGSLLTVR